MEIDFRKYGKTNLATFKNELLVMQQRTLQNDINDSSNNSTNDDIDERHVIILYNYLIVHVKYKWNCLTLSM